MNTPLDDAPRTPLLSDAIATQFYREHLPSSLPILWAGRPALGRVYYARMGVLVLLAVLVISGSLYGLAVGIGNGFLRVLITVGSVGLILWMLLMILGVIALTKSNRSSYYAFDAQSLYLYSEFRNQMRMYPLAALPDFIRDNSSEPMTLRCSFRKSKTEKGQVYKTPVLYQVPNGLAVLELLRQVQNEAKKQALVDVVTPSWLPRD